MRRLCPLLLLLLCACRTVPGTGRHQLAFMSEAGLADDAAAEFAKMPRADDPAGLARVRSVALKVIAAARSAPGKYGGPTLPPPAAWEIAIIKDDTPNAFAMPGGKIGFNAGMFRLTPSDEDIAVILGHEVAHVVCRHGNERASQGMAVSAGAAIVDETTKEKGEGRHGQAVALYGAVSTYGLLLPFSRTHEAEADELGLIYMARAGFAPSAAITFWERFAKEPGKRVPEFLSTHPSDETRIRKLRELVPAAQQQVPAAASSATPSPR